MLQDRLPILQQRLRPTRGAAGSRAALSFQRAPDLYQPYGLIFVANNGKGIAVGSSRPIATPLLARVSVLFRR